MKVLISASAIKSAKKSEGSKFVKAKSIAPALDKKLDSLVAKSVKARVRTLAQLEKATTAFKKKYPLIDAGDLKKQITKKLLANPVHPDYVDADGVLKIPTGGSVEELTEDCDVDLPLELYDDMLQEVYDTFRNYL